MTMRLLDTINSPQDLKRIPVAELPKLAQEIREEIISVVTRNGGHLGSNLGVVELTIALHYCFDFLADRLVWDVSHQTYAHKLLTGRREQFKTLRLHDGLGPFTSPEESPYDLYMSAHAGTAISTSLGLAAGHEMAGDPRRVVAVVGDAGFALGMSFEATNHAGELKKNMIVVLNDNKMSISRAVGALSQHLSRLRTLPAYEKYRRQIHDTLLKIPLVGHPMDEAYKHACDAVVAGLTPGHLFEAFGFNYLGPVDGHDIQGLIQTFNAVKPAHEGPILLHVVTQKGKGLDPAHGDPALRHGASPQVLEDGTVPPATAKKNLPSYGSVFAAKLIKLAEKDTRIVGITAAMPEGTGLNKFQERFPQRFFDVGICEQHAVGFASGLKLAGMRPVCAIYSTFLQRAFDQIFHEVALQKLPVVFCLDRAGIVGADGPTHHGLYDIAYFRAFPGTVLMAPKDGPELEVMLEFALTLDRPVSIRYPRGSIPESLASGPPLVLGRSETLKEGEDGALVAYGSMVERALAAAAILAANGIQVSVVNARFAKPIDTEMIVRMARRQPFVLMLEEHALAGGFGSAALEAAAAGGAGLSLGKIRSLGIPDRFIPHGSRDLHLAALGLSPAEIARTAAGILGRSLVVASPVKEAKAVSAAAAR